MCPAGGKIILPPTLVKEGVVEVLQERHLLRHRVLEIVLVDLVHAAVDDGLLHGLQAFLAAHHQLAEADR